MPALGIEDPLPHVQRGREISRPMGVLKFLPQEGNKLIQMIESLQNGCGASVL